jgi:hypothetical protein
MGRRRESAIVVPNPLVAVKQPPLHLISARLYISRNLVTSADRGSRKCEVLAKLLPHLF